MHPCPCCGFSTLPARGEYDLCPVCWWEDEGTGPATFSGSNNQTLIEAQQEFLDETRPRRPEGTRRPKRR